MFARIGRLFRGFFGLFISGLEEANPEALMEAARQEFRNKMTQYNLALAKMAGVAERLKSQVKPRPTKRAGSRAPHPRQSPRRQHGAGRDARARAAGAQGRPRRRHARAAGDRGGLPGQPASGEGRAAGVRGQGRTAWRSSCRRCKIKEAQAEAATALSSVAFKVGDLGDTMKTVEEVLQKRYEVSAGKARVAKDMVDIEAVTGEGKRAQGARAGALAEFLASQGIQTRPGCRAARRRRPRRSDQSR